MKQRVAIVGADNFVGQSIIRALKHSDWATPVAADFRFRNSHQSDHPHVALSGDQPTWNALIAQSDAVISCTTGTPGSIVASMRALATALQRHSRPLPLVHVSSMTVYGDASGLVRESQRPVGTLSAYAAARLEAEKLAASCPEVITLRSGCEYGPHCVHWSERVAEWLVARRLGDLGSAGDGYCNLTYIDDLANAALRALQIPSAKGMVFNIATDSPPSWNEYFVRFALALRATPVRRVTSRRIRVETKLLAIPLKLAEVIATRLGAKRSPLPAPIPPSLLNVCRQDIRLDVSQAEQTLGMKWTPVEAGLNAAAAAYFKIS